LASGRLRTRRHHGGSRHTLSSLRGPNGLLLMFICNHCPYVKAIIDRICRDARDVQTLGIGVAAIMSNDPVDYPEDSFENMQRLARQLDFPFPTCTTPRRTWHAPTGPSARPTSSASIVKLELQYRGRLDASGRLPAGPDARRELVEAMQTGSRDR
jgi:hypothetical protein